MQAIVLCGGKGTRLRPYTHSLPKPMLPLGRKPILEYTVEHLRKHGFTDLVFTVGHLRQEIMNYFGNGKKFGVSIEYAEEESELGTAGSVANSRKFIHSSDFLVLMGDQLTNLDYSKFVDFHKKHGSIASIALKKMGVPMQYGTVEIDAHKQVTCFTEKPILEQLINAGMYAFSSKIFDYLPAKGDFALNVFPDLMKKNQKIFGYVFEDYWVDVGSLHQYESINQTISLMDLIAGSGK